MKSFRSQVKGKHSIAREFQSLAVSEISCNSDRNIMQSIRITSRPPSTIRKENQLSQFRGTSTEVMLLEKTDCVLMMIRERQSQWFERGSKWRINSPTYLFLQVIWQFQVVTPNASPDMTIGIHAWLNVRIIETQSNPEERNFIEQIKASIFLVAVLARDNVRAPIHLRRESQPQHLNSINWIFLWRLPIHNHSKPSVKRWNKVKYPSRNFKRLMFVKKISMSNPVKSLGYIKY